MSAPTGPHFGWTSQVPQPGSPISSLETISHLWEGGSSGGKAQDFANPANSQQWSDILKLTYMPLVIIAVGANDMTVALRKLAAGRGRRKNHRLEVVPTPNGSLAAITS